MSRDGGKKTVCKCRLAGSWDISHPPSDGLSYLSGNQTLHKLGIAIGTSGCVLVTSAVLQATRNLAPSNSHSFFFLNSRSIMLTDLVGQEFGQGTVGMACLSAPQWLGPLLGRFESWGGSLSNRGAGIL